MVNAVSSSSTSTPLNKKSASEKTCNRSKPRHPLLPSESNSGKNCNVSPRRSKSREVSSRFLSTPSSSTSTVSLPRRCPSPGGCLPSKISPARAAPSLSPGVKRPQSAERRKSGIATRSNGLDLRIGCSENTNEQKMLMQSSRSLSVSFQGESFSYYVCQVKKKPPSTSTSLSPSTTSRRVASPERGRTTPTVSPRASDYARKVAAAEHQQRWPARLRNQSVFSLSTDIVDDRRDSGTSLMSLSAIMPSCNKSPRISLESRLRLESVYNSGRKSVEAMRTVKFDLPVNSDGDSMSSDGSGSTAGGGGQRLVHGKTVSARFWHENNIKVRGSDTPESPRSRTPVQRTATPNKFVVDSHVASPNGASMLKGQMSPNRSRHSSPNKFRILSPATASPSRGLSPTRSRNSAAGGGNFDLRSSTDSIPSMLIYTVDMKRGKIGDSKLFEFHLLKILYNRLLQWRFVNARADAALQAQKLDAERSLCICHKKTSKVLKSVESKCIELQQLRQNSKLLSLLNDQMVCLDEFALIEQQYLHSLSGAVEALRASTLRLPVVDAARVDIQSLKDAISSAVDVMQAMASSICTLLTTVSEINSQVVELSKLATMERTSLDQCKALLSAVASLQVKEYSLRIHNFQLYQVA